MTTDKILTKRQSQLLDFLTENTLVKVDELYRLVAMVLEITGYHFEVVLRDEWIVSFWDGNKLIFKTYETCASPLHYVLWIACQSAYEKWQNDSSQ